MPHPEPHLHGNRTEHVPLFRPHVCRSKTARLPLLEPHYKITIIKYAYVLETHPPQHPFEAEGRSPAAKRGAAEGVFRRPIHSSYQLYILLYSHGIIFLAHLRVTKNQRRS